MKHQIEAASRQDFVEKFRQIRESFVATLERELKGKRVTGFYASHDGAPCGWWNSETFEYDRPVGTNDDARAFLRNNIDEGFCVAFALNSTPNGWEVWFKRWESDEPDDADEPGDAAEVPDWPNGLVVQHEQLHHGIECATVFVD